MMNDPSDLFWLAMPFLPMLPLQFVCFVGMVLAVMRWRRHPTVSLLTLIAMILFSISLLAGTFFVSMLYRMDATYSWTSSELRTWFAILSYTRTGSTTVATVLLLIALFGWRYPPPQILRQDEAGDGPGSSREG